jgi:uncharacterized protein with ParB-like and HNH nuclease domain
MEFTPEQKVLNDLFGKDLSYIIPEYQRPYSWDCIGKSDKNNQVNVMWQDLIDFFDSGNQNIYFMGSMVVIGDVSSRKYEVVDGQQRMTTLSILIVSIKCFLKGVKENDLLAIDKKNDITTFIDNVIKDLDSLLFNQNLFGSIVQEKKVKIEKVSGFNYDDILEATMECADSNKVDMKNATEEQKEVALRYFKNRIYFTERLAEKFTSDTIFTYQNAQKLNEFIHFLKTKVTIIQIRSPRFDVAYQIFEILNNRGLPLSNKDLFRNFLISEFTQLKSSNPTKYAHIDANERWRNLEEKHIDVEFISRYVESMRGKKQQYSAFNDLQDLYKGNRFQDSLDKTKLDFFYADIESQLINYSKIISYDFDSPEIKNRITFLLNSGNASPILNLTLALFRYTVDSEKLLSFLKIFERYIIYMLLAPKARFQNSVIFDCIKNLNENEFEQAKEKILLTDEQKDELKSCFDSSITDNTTAKIMISRCFWANENQIDKDVVDVKLDFDVATLEHIIPQNPKIDTNWINDFSQQFRKENTYKLGNMTLLTKEKNSSVKNFDFNIKKKKYTNSKLNFTKELGSLFEITEDYITKRHNMLIELLIKDLEL